MLSWVEHEKKKKKKKLRGQMGAVYSSWGQTTFFLLEQTHHPFSEGKQQVWVISFENVPIPLK